MSLRGLVDELFVRWSSGNPDVIEPCFAQDAYLWDSVNGGFSGWPEIRQLYLESLMRWDNLCCVVTRSWPTDDVSIAFTWTITANVKDNRFGEHLRGAKCQFDGMSFIEFENQLVKREIEYFDRAAAARSIGLSVERVLFR